jgi:hypothetical protein
MSNSSTVEIIKNANSTIRMLDSEIFYVLYDKGIVISVDDFEETAAVYNEISEGRKLKFLVEFPAFITATADARKWAENNQVDAKAEAIVFSNLSQRLLIRFYILMRKQNHPVKVFSNKTSAQNWLESYE